MPNRAGPVLPEGRAVLVTGASSGLGQDCALHLAGLGFRVFAGVRRPEDGERLAAEVPSGRLRPLRIDVTDGDSIKAAAEAVADEVGDEGLWGLVNNAGICVCAPLEVVSPELLREQLETSVVGQVAVTQALLPLLRLQGGRIVNVTSGLGSVAIPFLGAYAAGQFAKEAVSDAFRRELAPSGVTVSVVQPGAIMTPIWAKVAQGGSRAIEAAPGPVAELYRSAFTKFLVTNEETARSSRTTPADFTAAVTDALTAPRPRIRHPVGRDVSRGRVLVRLLPRGALDRAFSKIARG